MAPRTHKREIEAIRRYVSLVGGVCNVLHQAGRLRGSAGIPDLYLQFPRARRSLWLEVKVGRDKLSPAQKAFLQREEDCGGVVIVGGLEEVELWWNQG